MHKKLLAVALSAALAVPALALGQSKPDFSGTWAFDQAKSDPAGGPGAVRRCRRLFWFRRNRAGVAHLAIDRAAAMHRLRHDGTDRLARIREVAGAGMGVASSLGLRLALRGSRERRWTVDIRSRLSQLRLGRGCLYLHPLSLSQRPNAESCTMIVCERSGPVETSPICTPICSDKKST